MLSEATIQRPQSDQSERNLLDQLLDVLPVTDTAFHALHHTQPLAEALLQRARQLLPNGGRVLLVAPNELLTEALSRLGYELGIWHVAPGSMSDELCLTASRSGDLDELLTGSLGPPGWDLVVLPYVLEAARLHPVELLGRLRSVLAPGGKLVVAYRRVGSLESRLNGLRGRPSLPDPYLHRRHVSLSWPNLGSRRRFGSAELRVWCGLAGFRIEQESLEKDSHATVPIEVMSIRHWLGAHARDAAKHSIPSLRDVGVATLSPHPGEPRDPSEGGLVTVVIFATRPSSSANLLRSLADQTYSREQLEAIVVHPDDAGFGRLLAEARGFPLRGLLIGDRSDQPGAANEALRMARGEVIGFTDDACTLPRGWVDTGAYAVGGWTAAVSGRVVEAHSANTAFAGLPGHPPTGEQGFFPIANSFYRRSALLEAGGFGKGGWEWQSEAASRLTALGYEVRFEETLYVARHIEPETKRGWLREEFEFARGIPSGLGRVRALGHHPLMGLFASRHTLYFDLLLAGLALAALRRQPAWALLALPYLARTADTLTLWPPAAWKRWVRYAGDLIGRQLVWLAGLLTGSVGARRLVL